MKRSSRGMSVLRKLQALVNQSRCTTGIPKVAKLTKGWQESFLKGTPLPHPPLSLRERVVEDRVRQKSSNYPRRSHNHEICTWQRVERAYFGRHSRERQCSCGLRFHDFQHDAD